MDNERLFAVAEMVIERLTEISDRLESLNEKLENLEDTLSNNATNIDFMKMTLTSISGDIAQIESNTAKRF